MNYYLKSDKNVVICIISNPKLLASLFKANGEWVGKNLVNGGFVNCYQFKIKSSIFVLTGLSIYIENNYYLQPTHND